MIREIRKIENYGKFKNFSSNSPVKFSKLNLIHAENAMGKSTFSAALRSVSTNSPELVIERQKLGAPNPPNLEFIFDGSKPVKFSDEKWSQPKSEILVFDDVYISENIYAGMVVSEQQKYNLQKLILGKKVVSLNQKLESLKNDIEVQEKILQNFDNRIPEEVRPGLSVEDFAELETNFDPDQKVADAVRDITLYHLNKLNIKFPRISPIKIPIINVGNFKSILKENVPELDSGPHSNYKNNLFHKNLNKFQKKFDKEHNQEVKANFSKNYEMYVQLREFLNKHVHESQVVLESSSIMIDWEQAYKAVIENLIIKRTDPYNKITFSADQLNSIKQHNSNCNAIDKINNKISDYNEIGQSLNVNTPETNMTILTNRLIEYSIAQSRKSQIFSAACSDYLDTKKEIQNKKQEIEKINNQISALKKEINPQHVKEINTILEEINADFRISEIIERDQDSANYFNYNLQINKHSIPITGNGSKQHFKNTLSAGDRNTLALAFFLTTLKFFESDKTIGNKIIVFDDPITSMDTNRIHFLQNRIAKLAKNAKCVIVLSHSKSFLRGIFKVSRDIKNRGPIQAYELVCANNNETKFVGWEIKTDFSSSSDFHRRLVRIINFISDNTSEDNELVANNLRLVLEEYCNIYFGVDFLSYVNLGNFFNDTLNQDRSKIKIPLDKKKITQLGELIDYTNPFHHFGRDSLHGKVISNTELTLNAKKALDFMNFPDDKLKGI